MRTATETTFTTKPVERAVPDVRGFQRRYESAVPEVPNDVGAQVPVQRGTGSPGF
jgi:hypothetical protein